MREKLPEGFQRSEFLLEHGAIDLIIPRAELRSRLALASLPRCKTADAGRDISGNGQGMTSRSLADWLAYLEQLHPTAIDMGLDRVRAVAARMAMTRPAPLVVTVTGTNGRAPPVPSSPRC